MTPLQILQMQLQMQQQLGRQQQMAGQQQIPGQQNFGTSTGGGLERFFNANTMTAAQRAAAAMPAQVWLHANVHRLGVALPVVCAELHDKRLCQSQASLHAVRCLLHALSATTLEFVGLKNQ